MELDMRTVMASYLITDIVSTLVIIQLWMQSHKHFKGVSFWAVNLIFQTAALMLIILRGIVPDWMSVILSNTLVIAGLFLGLIGFERFLVRKRNHIFNYIFIPVYLAIISWFTFVQPLLTVRIIAFSVAALIFSFQCAWILLYVAPDIRKITMNVGIVFIGYCIVHSIRIFVFFIKGSSSNDFFLSNRFDVFILLAFQVLTILLTYNLALMFNKRLLSDIASEREKFSETFHSSPYAIILSRLSDSKILEANNGFEEITGYARSGVLGKKVSDLNFWLKEEDRVKIDNELLKYGKVHQKQLSILKKSGEILTTLFSSVVFNIQNEKYVLSSINDITRLKETEIALKESEKQMRSFFENSLDAILLTAPDGRIFTVNPAACDMFGYTEEEIISLGRNGLVDITDPRVQLLLDERLRTGKARGELTFIRKDGTRFPAEVSSALFTNSSGEKRSSMIIHDITDRLQSEILLRKSEERYRSTLDNMMEGCQILDLDWRYLYINNAAEIHNRRPKEELLGNKYMDMWPGIEQTKVFSLIKQCLEERISLHLENKFVFPDGESGWFDLSIQPVPEGVFILSIDVTKRKKNEDELRESEERLRLSLYAANQGMYDLNIQTGEAIVNKEYALMLGYDPATFTETNALWIERLHPDDKIITAKAYTNYIEGKTNEYKVEFRQKTGNGGWKWILSMGKIVAYDLEEKPLRMMGTHTDITERKRAENNEKLTNEILGMLNTYANTEIMVAGIIESIKNFTGIEAVGIRLKRGEDCPYYYTSGFTEEFVNSERYLCCYNPDGSIIRDCNGDTLLECMCGNILSGRTDSSKSYFTKGGSFQSNCTTELLRETTDKDRLARTRNHCNSEGFESVALIPIHSGDKIVGLLQLNDHRENFFTEEMIPFFEGLCTSIGIALTRNEVEEEIKRLNEELEQRVSLRTTQLELANKELESFSYMVSHDLRAPLRAIDGFSKILTEDYEPILDDEGKRVCHIISENAQKMGLLIDDLLAFSRLSRAELTFLNIPMQTLANNVFMEITTPMEQQRIQFIIAELPDIIGDPSMIRQVWVNLLSNAIKFSAKKPQAIISLWGSSNNEFNTYWVKDNGVGFDKAYSSKLFGVFQRLHSIKEFDGIGVGLAIVKRIVEKHGGSVWAESEINNGATFYFSLPVKINYQI